MEAQNHPFSVNHVDSAEFAPSSDANPVQQPVTLLRENQAPIGERSDVDDDNGNGDNADPNVDTDGMAARDGNSEVMVGELCNKVYPGSADYVELANKSDDLVLLGMVPFFDRDADGIEDSVDEFVEGLDRRLGGFLCCLNQFCCRDSAPVVGHRRTLREYHAEFAFMVMNGVNRLAT